MLAGGSVCVEWTMMFADDVVMCSDTKRGIQGHRANSAERWRNQPTNHLIFNFQIEIKIVQTRSWFCLTVPEFGTCAVSALLKY